jgi:hypothetical protein
VRSTRPGSEHDVDLAGGCSRSGAAASARFDQFGTRNVVGFVTFFGGLVAVVPAAIVGALVGVPAWPFLGRWSVPCGALAGAAVIALGAVVALRLLGRAFERIDASA